MHQIIGRYRVTAATGDDGALMEIQTDSQGNLKMVNAADVEASELTTVRTTALATSLVVKASAGVLYEVRGDNDSASEQFIQIHDASALPADTAVPEEVFRIPADTSFTITFEKGLSFATGIVISNSSTLATKTIGAADCWFTADFI